MFYTLLLTGIIYSSCAAEGSDFEDFLSLLSNNNKYVSTNVAHKAKKNTKQLTSHEPFEMSFPFFYDIFPMAGFEGRMKDTIKSYQEDKYPSRDSNEHKTFSKIIKQKKPKDKVIMSFSEFFIPFSNQRNVLDIPTVPKKFDFFDDFFKDFPFREFEEPLLKHRLQRRLSSNDNSTKIYQGMISDNSTSSNTTNNKDTIQKLDLLFHKPKEAEIFLFQSGIDNTDTVGVEKQSELGGGQACCGNPECKMNKHCQEGICTDRPRGDDDYMLLKDEKKISKMVDACNSDRLVRIALYFGVPMLIGIGAFMIGVEILRKLKNIEKNEQILKGYDPIQQC